MDSFSARLSAPTREEPGDSTHRDGAETRQYLWRHRNAPNYMALLRKVKQVLTGWLNYLAVSDNKRSVHYFVNCIRRLIYQWFNNRGRKGAMNWKKLQPILDALSINAKVRLKPLYSLDS